MAITLSSTVVSDEGLFNRFAQGALLVEHVDTERGTTTDTDVQNLYQYYPTHEQTAISDLFGQRDSWRNAQAQWLTAIANEMGNTVAQQTNRDTPLIAVNYQTALPVLIQQMKDAVASIQKPTVTGTIGIGGSNVTDAVVAVSVKDGDGLQLDYAYPEVLTATVTSDAGTGGVAYQESVSIVGAAARNRTDYNWPGGSGANLSTQFTNAANATLLQNGDFEDWTGNVPDQWTVIVGTPGAEIVKGTDPLRGLSNLDISTTTGSALAKIRQAVTLQADSVYAVNVYLKIGMSGSGNIVAFRLVDGGGTTINDDQGGVNNLSVNSSSLNTLTYTPKNTFFRTPKTLPPQVFFEVAMTAEAIGSMDINIDLLAFTQATQLYKGGPWIGLFSGGTQATKGENWTITVANNKMTGAKFVRYLDRWFDLKSLSLKIPSAISPTLPDPG